MEIVSYGGWNRCARIVAGAAELIVTLEVGPRVIRYGLIGGPNEFVEHEAQMGQTGGDDYKSYGGHRLWIAPEIDARTLQPDNEPVEYTMDGEWHVFTAPVEKWFLQKEIRIKVVGDAVFLEHRIYNRGAYDAELAPWALTQLATGGTGYWPMPEFKPHNEEVLPARPLVMWAYTDLSDPRWNWSATVGSLRQDPAMPPQKVGSLVQQGYAAYANHGNLFFKRFAYEEGGVYPDYGCNFETFTNEEILEIESLGPLVTLPAGGVVKLEEAWYLLAGLSIPGELSQVGDMLAQVAAKSPLR